MVQYPPIPVAQLAPLFDVVNVRAFNINALPQETQCKWYQSNKVQALAVPIFAALGLICAAGSICSALLLVVSPGSVILAIGLAILSINLLSNSVKIYRSAPNSTDPEYRSKVREKVIDAFKSNQGFEKIANAFVLRTFEDARSNKLTFESVISHNDIDFLLTDDVLQLTFDQFLEKHGENVFKYLNTSNLSQIKQKFMGWMKAELLAKTKTLPDVLQIVEKCQILSFFKDTPEFQEIALSYIRDNKRAYIENKEDHHFQLLEQGMTIEENVQLNLRDLKDEYTRQKTLLDQAIGVINSRFQESKNNLEDEIALGVEDVRKTYQKVEEDYKKAIEEIKELESSRFICSYNIRLQTKKEHIEALLLKLAQIEEDLVFSSLRKQEAEELFKQSHVCYPELIAELEGDYSHKCELFNRTMNQEILDENKKFEDIVSQLEASLLEILQ